LDETEIYHPPCTAEQFVKVRAYTCPAPTSLEVVIFHLLHARDTFFPIRQQPA